MADIINRKTEHLKLALENESQSGIEPFADFELQYKALPDIDLKEVDTGVNFLGKKLDQPLVIASMTGGAEMAGRINENLAKAAEKCRVALGVGSQRAALEKPEMKETFLVVRRYAPKAVVLANMGLVQLNYGRSVEDYRRVVEMVEADGLYVHINPMQEALQPEGDTNWSDLYPKLENLIKKVGVPVFAKEVGNGLDAKTVKHLIDVGVSGIDVAGVGGTSWTWIEGRRANKPNLTSWFKEFGVSTEDAVKAAVKAKLEASIKVKIIASGGIRSPLQGLKAHILGADYYSAARPFLDKAIEGPEEVVGLIRDWQEGLKIAMFGCGMKKWSEFGDA